jgi:isoleucyl-tRNA synthetase
MVEDAISRGEPIHVTMDAAVTGSTNVATAGQVQVDPEDVTVVKSYGDDWAGASDGQTIVLLDKRLTPELKNEGIARDIIRHVQNHRKEKGLEICDRIILNIQADTEELRSAIEAFREQIAHETLAERINDTATAGPGDLTVAMGGIGDLAIVIEKTS